MNNVILKMKYDSKNDVLRPHSDDDRRKMKLFRMRLEDTQVIEMYAEVFEERSTRPQQNKLHKLMRELSLHTGHSLEEVKLLIKKEAGLLNYLKDGFEMKSFGDCSKAEMGYAIQTCINIGMKADCPMY